MRKDIAEKWVVALKSGEYKQTQSYLKTDEGFCCLGVLCDLYAKENSIGWKEVISTYYDESEDYKEDYHEIDGSTETLPHSVRDWADMYSDEGDFKNGLVHPSLVSMNDDLGNNFLEIAEVIEKNYEHL